MTRTRSLTRNNSFSLLLLPVNKLLQQHVEKTLSTTSYTSLSKRGVGEEKREGQGYVRGQSCDSAAGRSGETAFRWCAGFWTSCCCGSDGLPASRRWLLLLDTDLRVKEPQLEASSISAPLTLFGCSPPQVRKVHQNQNKTHNIYIKEVSDGRLFGDEHVRSPGLLQLRPKQAEPTNPFTRVCNAQKQKQPLNLAKHSLLREWVASLL